MNNNYKFTIVIYDIAHSDFNYIIIRPAQVI